MKLKFLLFTAICLVGCSDPPDDDQFLVCNDSLGFCDFSGEYCLFGLKWGDMNDFANRGIEVEGPQTPGGLVTYSFQESPTLVSNHRQIDVPTLSIDALPSCAKDMIRSSFDIWASAGNIEFEELSDDSDSQIKIFVAPVTTCGSGFPNFTFSPCDELAGTLILSPNFTTDCNIFQAYVLHELGHVLGLGHSSRDNIMGSISGNLDGISEGDINGMKQIYGE